MFQVMSRTNSLFSRTLISYTLLANLCITCTQKNTIATHSYARPGHGNQPCGLELMAGGMPKAVNNGTLPRSQTTPTPWRPYRPTCRPESLSSFKAPTKSRSDLRGQVCRCTWIGPNIQRLREVLVQNITGWCFQLTRVHPSVTYHVF